MHMAHRKCPAHVVHMRVDKAGHKQNSKLLEQLAELFIVLSVLCICSLAEPFSLGSRHEEGQKAIPRITVYGLTHSLSGLQFCAWREEARARPKIIPGPSSSTVMTIINNKNNAKLISVLVVALCQALC